MYHFNVNPVESERFLQVQNSVATEDAFPLPDLEFNGEFVPVLKSSRNFKKRKSLLKLEF